MSEEIKGIEERSEPEKREEIAETENRELRQKINQLEEIIRWQESRIRELEKETMTDHLTGLKTRRYFEHELLKIITTIESEQNRGTRERRKGSIGFDTFSILFCDIDNFKRINDTYGHKIGDEILRDISQIIQSGIRDLDIACRFGGEEIVVAFLGAEEEAAMKKAEELRRLVEEEIRNKYQTNYPDLRASLSIGVAVFQPGLDFEEIIQRADQAMYAAKESGKNRVMSYQENKEEDNPSAGNQ